ncbi:MAG: flagellar basal body L-ring protein FlgH [Phycisphaeraceae bacterium]
MINRRPIRTDHRLPRVAGARRSAILSVLAALLLIGVIPGDRAGAQSSSLYLQGQQAAPPAQQPSDAEAPGRPLAELQPSLAQLSFAAVSVPEPRRLGRHDLVTVIIRESLETDFSSSLQTSRDVEFDGEVTEFPRFQLRELLNAQINPNDFEQGRPRVGVEYGQSFDGDGDYRREESITGRITARVIDVKPNGTVVLEARKYLEADDETLDLVLTGTARAEDITADNTILSTQLYDLRLSKEHTGELRRSSRKGIFTRILETIFNF